MQCEQEKKKAHTGTRKNTMPSSSISLLLFGLICFSLVLLPNAPSISCSLVFSFNYVLIVGYEHCPNGPCEFPFFVCSSLIPLVAVTKTTISKLLGTTLAVHVATSDKSVVKLKKKKEKKMRMTKITWGSSRIDDVDTVGGHQTPLRVGYIAANGSTLGERSDVVVTECFAAPACPRNSKRFISCLCSLLSCQ